jgi:inorganic triphosphatase YgiF
MSQEIELKLAIPRSMVSALRRHPLFAAAPPAGPRQTLINTYFDTPALLLKDHRIALRTRKQGRAWLQTVKCGGEFAGGLAQRPEWEHPYGGDFDFSPVDDPAVRSLLEAHAADLQPLFTTNFRRETRRHAPRAGVEILLMLDVGQVEAAGQTLPLSELELELAEGTEHDLFELALALAADLPLVPEDLSKAQRGYQLYLDQTVAPMKALPSRLQPEDSPVTAFRALAADCVRQWQANASGAATSPDPEFIHQMRVALRRLRSLVRIMAPALPAEFVAEWNRRLREEASRLGRARDLDVLLDTIIGPAEAAAEPPPGLAGLRHKAEETRREARAQTVATLAKGAHGHSLLAFTAALHQLPSNSLDRSADLANFARLQLGRLRKRARRRLEEAHEQPGAEGLHAVRIALKRLRYGLEFFQPLCAAKPARRLLAQISDVQDDLGFLHDLEVALRYMQGWAADQGDLREAAAFVAGWHGHRALRLTAELPDRIGRLLRKRPPLK